MDFTKLNSLDVKKESFEPDTIVSFIIQVKQENYVPQELQVRSKIDGFIFTAQCLAKDLNILENDPLIDNISIATKLYSY